MLDPSEVPLHPSPNQARGWLLAELSKPQYEKRGLMDRISEWISRWLDSAVDAGESGLISRLAVIVVFAVLILVVGWLVARTRRTARVKPAGEEILDTRLSAQDHGEAARRAFEAGDYSAALISAFRAIAVGGVEAGIVEDRPASTAHEVVAQLVTAHAADAADIRAVGLLFDEAAYGERALTAAEASRALELGERLKVRR